MKIAFEKNIKNPFDLLVKLRTWSNYYHCELVFDFPVKLAPAHLCWSAKAFQGVRFKYITLNSKDWDVYDISSIPHDWEVKIYNWCRTKCGEKYDYLGILGRSVPADIDLHDDKDLFCSEGCTRALQQIGWFPGVEPYELAPKDLYDLLVKNKYIQGRS